MAKKRRKRRKLKKGVVLILILMILGGISFGGYEIYQRREEILATIERKKLEEEQRKREAEEARRKEALYNECLNETYSEDDKTFDLVQKEEEVTGFIKSKNYRASVYFEDLDTAFSYGYQETKSYYGCSLIKIVDALYLINKAIAGEVDLDEVSLKYTANYRAGYSSGMAKHKIGDMVSLRELIKHAISVSDNTAHLMLIDYIGFDNLKNYGKSLGAKVILSGGDKFGNQTAEDTNIYLKEAYRIITENEEYGAFLKEIMDNDERNDFNTEDIRIYHKYGSYDTYYHDIGLSLEEKPYAVSILTRHEYSNHKEVVQSIHERLRELQEVFYKERASRCRKKVYQSSEES